MHGYWVVFYFLDEHCCVCGCTIDESMRGFSIVGRECFESEYLKQPTHVDILCHLNINDG